MKGWSKSTECIEWNVKFVNTGIYRIEIITDNLFISDKTRDEAKIQVALPDEGSIITNLRKDFTYSDSRTSSFNTRVGTICGKIKINKVGTHSVQMRLIQNLNCDTEGIPLVALRFVMEK